MVKHKIKFRIGFPVDTGNKDDSFCIVTRVKKTKNHYVKNGRSGPLRRDSGADFVISHAPRCFKDNYRFEFEILPESLCVESVTPENITDVGYSDASACALAILSANYQSNKSPLIIVSAQFYPEEGQTLKDLTLDSVAREEKEKACYSLLNKIEASINSKAIAFIIHDKDADLIKEHVLVQKLKYQSLNKLYFNQDKKMAIFSCSDWQLLQKCFFKKTFFTKKFLPVLYSCLVIIMLVFLFIQMQKKINFTESSIKIENTKNWNRKKFGGVYGENGSNTWGQILTSPKHQSSIVYFSFFFKVKYSVQNGHPFMFKAYICEWSDLEKRPINILYKSKTINSRHFTKQPDGIFKLTHEFFLDLEAKKTYVILFSTTENKKEGRAVFTGLNSKKTKFQPLVVSEEPKNLENLNAITHPETKWSVNNQYSFAFELEFLTRN